MYIILEARQKKTATGSNPAAACERRSLAVITVDVQQGAHKMVSFLIWSYNSATPSKVILLHSGTEGKRRFDTFGFSMAVTGNF